MKYLSAGTIYIITGLLAILISVSFTSEATEQYAMYKFTLWSH